MPQREIKRVAIVGLGAAARNIHLPAYAMLKDRVRVVAGCDPDAAAAGRSGVPQVYPSVEAMIEGARPDVVAICTPPALHVRQTLTALEMGCNVFCEKPLAESLEDADAVIRAAEQVGRHVVVNTQFPAMEIHSAAKRLIGSPAFGRLLFLHAWQTFRPTDRTEAGWRASMRRRLCFEFGIHVFELVRFFFDAVPVRLQAHMPSPAGDSSPEAINVISMEFADGRAASVVLDRLSKGPEQYLSMRLDGEHACIRTSIGGEMELRLGVHAKARRPFARVQVAGGGTAVLETGDRSRVLAREGLNPFASATARHFGTLLDALDGAAEPLATARDHRITLALVFAAYHAAETGTAVNPIIFEPEGVS
jgi:predicted dehydrogenase